MCFWLSCTIQTWLIQVVRVPTGPNPFVTLPLLLPSRSNPQRAEALELMRRDLLAVIAVLDRYRQREKPRNLL